MKNGILFLFLTLIVLPSISAQDSFRLFGNLDFGPFEVGTKQVSIDQATKETSKSLNIQIWHPTNESGEKVVFSDYLNYKRQLKIQELLESASIGISGKTGTFPQDSLELLLNSKMKASKNVPIQIGKFPFLVWSMRYGTIEHQNIISEYLASHGYVVAFVEDIPNSPFPWQMSSAEEKELAINHQIADLNHTINYLKQLPYTNPDKIGLLSWSYAGELAILTQMDNPDVDLVVGLSSIGFSYGLYLGAELPKKIKLNKLQVPYLILSEKIGTNGKERTTPNIFNQMHPESRYVSFKELSHGNFNAMEGMIPGILNTNKVQNWSKGGELAQLGYETICKTALAFINATLQPSNSGSFDSQMTELIKTLPTNFMSVFQPKTEN